MKSQDYYLIVKTIHVFGDSSRVVLWSKVRYYFQVMMFEGTEPLNHLQHSQQATRMARTTLD